MNSLREKRKELGYTQVEAARIAGVSRRTYQTYEENPELEEARQKILDIIANVEKNRILGQLFIKFKCAEIFKNYPEVKCAYLYGSYARKEATPESDVDILVVCHNMGLSFFGMAAELKNALGKEVDLQTIEQLEGSVPLIESILTEGIKIYDKRHNRTSSWHNY